MMMMIIITWMWFWSVTYTGVGSPESLLRAPFQVQEAQNPEPFLYPPPPKKKKIFTTPPSKKKIIEGPLRGSPLICLGASEFHLNYM